MHGPGSRSGDPEQTGRLKGIEGRSNNQEIEFTWLEDGIFETL
jgi:hypothetical protein